MKKEFVLLNIETFISKFCNLFIFYSISNLLGLETLGVYSLITSFVFIFSNFADLSINPLLLMTLYKKQFKKANSLFTFNLLTSIISLFLLILLAFFVNRIFIIYFLLAGIIQIIDVLTSVYITFFQYKNKLLNWAKGRIIYRLIITGLSIVLLVYYKNLFALFITGTIISLGYYAYLFLIIRNLHPKLQLCFENLFDQAKALLIFGTTLMLTVFITQFDKIFLSSVGTLNEVGYYSIANKFILIFFTLGTILANIYLPVLMNLHFKKNKDIFFKSYINYNKIMSLLIILIAIALILFTPLIVKIFFNTPQYNLEIINLTYLMIPYLAFYLLSTVAGAAMTALELQRQKNWTLFFGIIAFIVICLISWPYFRTYGLVLALNITFFIVWLINITLIEQKLLLWRNKN